MSKQFKKGDIAHWSPEYAEPGDAESFLVVVEDLGDRVRVCEKPIMATNSGGLIARGVFQTVAKGMLA